MQNLASYLENLAGFLWNLASLFLRQYLKFRPYLWYFDSIFNKLLIGQLKIIGYRDVRVGYDSFRIEEWLPSWIHIDWLLTVLVLKNFYIITYKAYITLDEILLTTLLNSCPPKVLNSIVVHRVVNSKKKSLKFQSIKGRNTWLKFNGMSV